MEALQHPWLSSVLSCFPNPDAYRLSPTPFRLPPSFLSIDVLNYPPFFSPEQFGERRQRRSQEERKEEEEDLDEATEVGKDASPLHWQKPRKEFGEGRGRKGGAPRSPTISVPPSFSLSGRKRKDESPSLLQHLSSSSSSPGPPSTRADQPDGKKTKNRPPAPSSFGAPAQASPERHEREVDALSKSSSASSSSMFLLQISSPLGVLGEREAGNLAQRGGEQEGGEEEASMMMMMAVSTMGSSMSLSPSHAQRSRAFFSRESMSSRKEEEEERSPSPTQESEDKKKRRSAKMMLPWQERKSPPKILYQTSPSYHGQFRGKAAQSCASTKERVRQAEEKKERGHKRSSTLRSPLSLSFIKRWRTAGGYMRWRQKEKERMQRHVHTWSTDSLCPWYTYIFDLNEKFALSLSLSLDSVVPQAALLWPLLSPFSLSLPLLLLLLIRLLLFLSMCRRESKVFSLGRSDNVKSPVHQHEKKKFPLLFFLAFLVILQLTFLSVART